MKARDAYRGAGRPEAAYVIERLMDKAAMELGIDPVELRRRNFITPTQMPYGFPAKGTIDSGDFARNMDDALEMAHVEVRADGEVHVVAGTQSNGQGHETAYAQVVAAELGVDIARVKVSFGDSDRLAHGGGSSREVSALSP